MPPWSVVVYAGGGLVFVGIRRASGGEETGLPGEILDVGRCARPAGLRPSTVHALSSCACWTPNERLGII